MRRLLPPSVTRTLCAELATPWQIDIIIRAGLKKSSFLFFFVALEPRDLFAAP